MKASLPSVATRQRCAFQFGCYHLEPEQGLSRAGVRIPLAPKELAVLGTLVSRDGDVVAKQQILDQVWPNEVVGEESLTRCIYVIRQRLDTPGSASLIETVHRRGYRIAVPVRRVAPSFIANSVAERSISTAPTAYVAYLEGRAHARQSSPLAIQFFRDALRADPQYAAALVGVADCHIHDCIYGALPAMHAARLALEAYEQAIMIDPDLASAYAGMAWLAGTVERRHTKALGLFEHALRLDPTYALTYHYRADVLRGIGDHNAAINDLERARSLDPYTSNYDVSHMSVLLASRRFEQAVTVGSRVVSSAMASESSRACAFAMLCGANTMQGNFAEADAAAKIACARAQGHPLLLTFVAHSLAVRGMNEESQNMVDEIIHNGGGGRVVKSFIPSVYVGLKQTREASQWLQRAADEHCPWLLSVLHDPRIGTLGVSHEKFLSVA